MRRTAAIIREDGGLTEPFDLGTGFPQGNNPSPKQFNVCGQVLIFKIEYNPTILPIELLRIPAGPLPVPVPVLVLTPVAAPDPGPYAPLLPANLWEIGQNRNNGN
jgi:hypothetical protein